MLLGFIQKYFSKIVNGLTAVATLTCTHTRAHTHAGIDPGIYQQRPKTGFRVKYAQLLE